MRESYDREKERVRRHMRAARAQVSSADAVRRSAEACARLVAAPVFAATQSLVAYVAIGRELDPATAVEVALRAGKHVYYPAPDEPGFVLATANGAGPVRLSPEEPALFVVPGLAFDLRGVRLGRGAGWYDRALGRYPHAVRIGFAYDFQVIPCLPEAPWDVRVHAIATETRLTGKPLRDRGMKKENRRWS